MKTLFRYSAFFVCFLVVFKPTMATAITAEKTCAIEASGEGCIYDLTANANGTLTACTKAGRAAVRWRASAAQVNIPTSAVPVSAPTVQSNVGTGSTTMFTGCVTRPVSAGQAYEVIVTYERPLLGTFPTTVKTQITAPVNIIPDSRPLSIVELKSCQQINETALGRLAAVDEEPIACGALLRCRLDPSGDTDSFNFTAVSGQGFNIRVTPLTTVAGCTGWSLYSPNGTPINNNLFFCESSKDVSNLPGSGSYRFIVSNTANSVIDYIVSFQGISQSSQCGIALSYAISKSGRLEVKGDSDTFSFIGLVNQTVNIKVTPITVASGCTGWSLYGPNGTSIDNNLFFCESSKNVSLPAGGTYTVYVSNNNNSVVDYRILVTKVSGP